MLCFAWLKLKCFKFPLASVFVCSIQKVQLEALGARKARISAIPNAVSFWVQKETKAFLCTLDALPDTKRMVYAIYMHRVSFSKAQKGQCFQQHDDTCAIVFTGGGRKDVWMNIFKTIGEEKGIPMEKDLASVLPPLSQKTMTCTICFFEKYYILLYCRPQLPM